ncbi:uncharacterized protein LOC111991103 [Quercus suber]|uniref:uncharacterized protein LOC111991103 n=1 Tax=Quercus suber TaxID=58331 RepID=UPI0032DEB609
MAKVAAQAPSSLQIGGGGAMKASTGLRRKTPSELRGEQLKQTNVIDLVDESPGPLVGTANDTDEVDNGLKKPEISKNPRYIDTRMDEVFPVKKSRVRMLSGKENAKENNSIEQTGSLKNISLISSLAAKRRHQLLSRESSVASSEDAKDGAVQVFQSIGKCSQSTFRSVNEISSVSDKSSGLATIDMDKALKGLAALDPPAISGSHFDSSERPGDPTSTYSGNFCSECHLPGRKAPLDFTLKTCVRMVSSSPVNRIHRSIISGTMPQFTFQFGHSEDQNNSHSSVLTSTSHVLSSKVMHSWVYPQSTLPSSLISVLISSAAEGVEMDFLRKRQLAWEDSFRSLYYMLRNNVCNLFYVCTSHFVVMFNGGDSLGRNKRSCNAYISRSTRGLRSMLREHDVCFSMPLCHSKVEQVTTEDLVELSEIEKHNLGQTRRLSSLSDIDNSSQSLLVFSGNKNVHGLYDFLLNYRSFLTSLTAMDVPLLCSPVPFQNAALSAPEVCVNMYTRVPQTREDVCFSMPLCHSKVEQVTTEDLVELSEIEKHNLGQTRRLSSLSDIDNSSQSLLVFSGNKNVHGLYDFLLNYRSFLTSLTAMDVPLLCSPVPFQNAALSAPEVRCMELKRADHIAAPPKGSTKDGECIQGSSAGLCYTIEIKDAYLPPWIICSVCAVMGSEGRSFEASFITEPTSVGLNVALGATCEKSDSQAAAGEGLQESSFAFGIPEAIVTPSLCSGLLKGLKYDNGSYTASLCPI